MWATKAVWMFMGTDSYTMFKNIKCTPYQTMYWTVLEGLSCKMEIVDYVGI